MSLEGQYEDDNIFAKIIRGDMPSVKIFEDENTLAIMDAFPQSNGHCLVIHKHEKARNLIDVSGEGLGHIMTSVQKLAKAVKTSLSPDGIVITQFNGAPAGQTVFHLHFHIIPRYEDFPMLGHASEGMADPQALAALAEQIKAAL